MYHSITFGEKNTWEDWHLIPSSRPLFSPPKVRTKNVEIPGANGDLDLTTVLTGEPLFDNRTGSFEFYVDQGYWTWVEAYSSIMDYLHGEYLRAILEDDPDHYYEGRFTVNSWKSDKDYSKISIDYNVDPFRRQDASVPNLSVSGSTTVSLVGSRHRAPVKIGSTAAMTLAHGGKTYEIPISQTPRLVEGLFIQNGRNELTFTGTGTVNIDYRRLDL